MSPAVIPFQWIGEYAVAHKQDFNVLSMDTSFLLLMLELFDRIALSPDQPQLPPLLLIALLRRVFSNTEAAEVCNIDNEVSETIDYLEQLEKRRLKRIAALKKRGGQQETDFMKTADKVAGRYAYGLHGVKTWVI
jgi:hypothetical protein